VQKEKNEGERGEKLREKEFKEIWRKNKKRVGFCIL